MAAPFRPVRCTGAGACLQSAETLKALVRDCPALADCPAVSDAVIGAVCRRAGLDEVFMDTPLAEILPPVGVVSVLRELEDLFGGIDLSGMRPVTVDDVILETQAALHFQPADGFSVHGSGPVPVGQIEGVAL